MSPDADTDGSNVYLKSTTKVGRTPSIVMAAS